MEKPLAQAAGIGWQGKHTNLLSREHGSWLFLGVIYTTLDLEPDEPAEAALRKLHALHRRVPDQAFIGPHRLDARRCISYLTIEHAGPIPHEFREAIGNRIYGCDDCLAVCPWNRFAGAAQANRRSCRAPSWRRRRWPICWRSTMRRSASCSPARRSSGSGQPDDPQLPDRAGNSGDPGCVAGRAASGSDDPVVADAAKWALDRLLALRSRRRSFAG